MNFNKGRIFEIWTEHIGGELLSEPSGEDKSLSDEFKIAETRHRTSPVDQTLKRQMGHHFFFTSSDHCAAQSCLMYRHCMPTTHGAKSLLIRFSCSELHITEVRVNATTPLQLSSCSFSSDNCIYVFCFHERIAAILLGWHHTRKCKTKKIIKLYRTAFRFVFACLNGLTYFIW